MNGSVENGNVNEDDQFAHLEKNEEDQEQPAEEPQQKKKIGLLPENRQERLAILLKNLPNEDLVHVNENKIPAFLRIDKDVKNNRAKLHELQTMYMDFNIADLDKEVKQSLANKITEVSKDFI